MVDRTRPPRPQPTRGFHFPLPRRYALENGLSVITARTARTPLVVLRLLVPAGGERSPTGAPGLAALTAALLDEGTRARSSLELAAATESLGGYLSSSADWDSTRIETEMFAADLEVGLEILADVAADAAFPEFEVDRLRRQTLAHLERRATQPATVARDVFNHALFGSAVYGWPLVGVEASVARFEREPIADFYRHNGSPSGSALVAVGDLEPERLVSLAADALGRWQGARPAAADVAPAQAPTERRILIVDRPQADQTELVVGQLGIPRRDRDWLIATVMNSLLGGKFTSRLNLALRERLALTYGVSSHFTKRRGAGPFVVATAVENEGAGRAAREILAELERLRQEPVDIAELAETVEYLIGIFPYTCETTAGIAERLADLALYDLPLDYYGRLPAALASITRDDVQACAQRLLKPEQAIVTAVGPSGILEPILAPLGAVEHASLPAL